MLRMLVSPTRSGSTAFLRCFENNPAIMEVYHQPVKSGFRQDGTFDYQFFSLDEGDESSIYIAKETVGGFAPPETRFNPLTEATSNRPSIAERFPSVEAIEKVRPLVLFRDPMQTWNSINKLNKYSKGKSEFHSPFRYFISSYRNVFEFLMHAKGITRHAYCLTLERLASNPYEVLRDVCSKWQIKFHDQMIEWSLPYGQKTHYSEETMDRMEHDARFKKSKESLEKSWRFHYTESLVRGIRTAHRRKIQNELQPLYDQAIALAAVDFPLSAD